MTGERIKIIRNEADGTVRELQRINTSPVRREVLISASCLSLQRAGHSKTPPISRARLIYSCIHLVACDTKTIREAMFACIKIQHLIGQCSNSSFKVLE